MRVTSAAVVLLVCCGCSGERVAARAAIGLAVRAKPAFSQESDIELARASVPSGLKQLEGFLLVAGAQRAILEMLAEGYCGWGAGFLQDDWETEVLERGGDGREEVASIRSSLGRCARYAAMQLPAPLDRVMELDEPLALAALARARAADALPLYRIAAAHATLLGVTQELSLALLAPRMISVLRRVIALAPEIDAGQAKLLLGVLLVAAPRIAGGDPALGEQLFAEARAISSGRLLLVDVLAARTLAVARGDRARFVALLRGVLMTSPAVWPHYRLANELAHRTARRSLRVIDRWFPREK